MVEELDLTDQDVTAIAEMIDTEIHSYIPEWAPGDLLGDHVDTEVSISDNIFSEGQDGTSPLTNESAARSGSLVLERMPSGRKYWSDSPKAGDAVSPHRLGPSTLSQEESATPAGSLTDDEMQSTAGCQYEDNVNDDYSLEKQNVGVLDDIVENHESNLSDCSHGSLDSHSDSITHSLSENKTLDDTDIDDDNMIVEKIENLLLEQQRELEELKKKHKQILSDLLKDIPPETLEKVVRTCNMEISDYKFQSAEE